MTTAITNMTKAIINLHDHDNNKNMTTKIEPRQQQKYDHDNNKIMTAAITII